MPIGLVMIDSFDPLTMIPSLRCFGIQNILNLLPFLPSIPQPDCVGGYNSIKSQSWETYHSNTRTDTFIKLDVVAHIKSHQFSLHHFQPFHSHSC
jgi:hypothetical protein